jgi:hypothetical protein
LASFSALRVLAGERRAVNAVASRARADRNDRVAHALGDRTNEFVFAQHANAHGVHQRVAFVRGIEHHFAAHGGHADAVAVVADALHDAGEQVAHARGRERTEAQRVEQGDGDARPW